MAMACDVPGLPAEKSYKAKTKAIKERRKEPTDLERTPKNLNQITNEVSPRSRALLTSLSSNEKDAKKNWIGLDSFVSKTTLVKTVNNLNLIKLKSLIAEELLKLN
ncbi:unnamed protein product [Ixodes persulcatus]